MRYPTVVGFRFNNRVINPRDSSVSLIARSQMLMVKTVIA